MIWFHLPYILFMQFFNTEPFPCDPSTLPKYPPTKEMDAKRRDDEARRSVFSDLYFCSCGFLHCYDIYQIFVKVMQ